MAQSDKRSLKYDDFKWGKALGEGSFGEVVQAELKDAAKEHYKFKDQFFAVKRLSISFLNKEQMIKERTGMDYEPNDYPVHKKIAFKGVSVDFLK